MKNFLQIATGIDVLPVLLSIKQHPELWDKDQIRRTAEDTPHSQMKDIWVRYKSDADPVTIVDPHFAVWYPAYYSLPVKQIIFGMMARMEATHLGGVLITRIPPGGRIEPHTDKGWHPEFYNTKLYLPLATNDKCWFRVEDEVVVMKTGEVWWLDNTVEHEIVNEGDTERITLIVCMRRD